MRRCLHTLCSLLVLATYLWGGCVSCEQFFMVPGAADDCCKHGKCEETQQSDPARPQPTQPERVCTTMPFAHQQHTVSTLAMIAADLPVNKVPAAELISLHESRWQARDHFDPLADSPPDLVLLTGSFLI